uniref:PKD/REJ-like domain-containing protein n=1 Tax=Aureoumbra lagunensis TaxID=44058 RepID=A0A7S3JQH1_9STRA|mmetsp:Transcript_2927/g.3784  ORF Transcript_2927/g.3784 Transcript_2927/m.3784 type:complete len:1847 (+) Transcript_2927:83-5623(+)
MKLLSLFLFVLVGKYHVCSAEECGLLSSVNLLDDGYTIEVEFIAETDQGGKGAGLNFDCSEIFIGIEDVTCYFVDASRLFILENRVDEIAIIEDTVSLLAEEGCGLQSIVLDTSEEKLNVEIVLEAQEEIASCEKNIILDARQTRGSGGRALDFEWSIAGTLLSQGLYLVPLPTNSNVLQVSVKATNYLGFFDIFSTEILIQNQNVPNIKIIGGTNRTTTKPSLFSITANAQATSCENRSRADRGVSYSWILQEKNKNQVFSSELIGLVSRDPRTFLIPAYFLNTSSTYVVKATATDLLTGLSASTTSIIYVEASDLFPLIQGGSRSISVHDDLKLNANFSYDPDLCPQDQIDNLRSRSLKEESNVFYKTTECNFHLLYSWSCRLLYSNLPSILDNIQEQRCIGFELLSTRSSILYLPAGTLSANATYEFILEISDRRKLSRTAITSVTIQAVDAISNNIFVLDASTVDNKNTIVANRRLSIFGFSKKPELLTWTLEEGALQNDLALNDYVTTPLAKVNNATFPLVLPIGSLIPGGNYRFQLASSFSKAWIDLHVAQGPVGGILQIEPQIGYVLSTSFDLTTFGWASFGNDPLTFRFEVREDDLVTPFKVLRSNSLSTILQAVTLFAGDPLPIFVVATNTLGATAEAGTTATVLPFPGSLDELKTISIQRIQEAFVFFERENICQISTAAAMDAQDSSLRDVLVSNLNSAWNLYDITSDQIAEFITAFTSALNAPDSITFAAAIQALNRTLIVATRLAQIPIVDVLLDTLSSADMTLILSNLLESDIFSQSSNDEDFSVADFGLTIDALASVRLRDRVIDEDEDIVQKDNIQIATRRLSGIDSVSLPLPQTGRRRLLELEEEEDQQYNGSVIVPALGEAVDVKLSELLLSPYEESSTGTILRFGVERLAALSTTTEIPSSETAQIVLIIPQLNPSETLIESEITGFASVNVSCPWNYFGQVSAECPLDESVLLTAGCNGTGGDLTLSCGERSQTQCAEYSQDVAWNMGACTLDTERSTRDEIYCICEISTNGDATDYSSQQIIEAYFKAKFRGFIGSGFNADRAFIMLIFLGIYILVAAILVTLGHFLDFRDLKNEVGAPPQAELSQKDSSLNIILATRSLRQRQSHRIILQRLLKDGRSAWRQDWWTRFKAALYHRHPMSSIWIFAGKFGTSRSKRIFILSVEIIMLMCTVAIENHLQYPDPGCSDRKSRDRCRKFESDSGRKLCQWRESSGDCEYRGPPADDFGRLEHFIVVLVAMAILLPCIILFERAYLGVVDQACWSYQFGCHTIFHSAYDDLPLGGAPPLAETSMDGIIEKRRGIEFLSSLPSEHETCKNHRRSSMTERVRTILAAKSDAALWLEATTRTSDTIASVLKRRDELRAAMALACQENTARGARAAYILAQLEQELLRKWRFGPDQKGFEQRVTYIIYKMLLKARNWQRELELIDATDEELKALYIAIKAQTVVLSKYERRIYENASVVVASEKNLRKNKLLDIEEPSRILFFAALLFTIAAIFAPGIWLLIYASDIGRRETKAFFVDTIFEFFIIFGMVFPLQIWIRFVILPAIVAEKIDHLMSLPESAPRTYPYQTPLNEDAIDYLLEQYPQINHSLQHLDTPSRIPFNSRFNGFSIIQNSKIIEDSDAQIVSENVSEKKEDATNIPPLEELEQLYEHVHWRPLWTSTIVFIILRGYMILPPVLQEYSIELSILAIPLIAFAGFSLITANFPFYFLLIIVLILAWVFLVALAQIAQYAHRRAHHSRQLSMKYRQQSLEALFPDNDGDTSIKGDNSFPQYNYNNDFAPNRIISTTSSTDVPVHAEEESAAQHTKKGSSSQPDDDDHPDHYQV